MHIRTTASWGAIVLLAAAAAQAELTLVDSQHLDVTSSYSDGNLYLYDSSSVDVSGGHIPLLVAFNEAQMRVLQTASPGSIGTATLRDRSVAVLFGGTIVSLSAGDQSSVEVAGGNVVNLWASPTANVTVSGGSVGVLTANGNAVGSPNHVAVSGGIVEKLDVRLSVSDGGTFDFSGVDDVGQFADHGIEVSGGTVLDYSTSFNVSNGSEYRLFAGDVADLYVVESHARVSGGRVTGRLTVVGGSSALMEAGDVAAAIVASGALEISGGTLTGVDVASRGSVQMSGGTVAEGGLTVSGQGHASITDGTFTFGGPAGLWGGIDVRQQGVIDIFGGGVDRLRAMDEGVIYLHAYDVEVRDGLTIEGNEVVGDGALAGKWLDGTPWQLNVWVNEPGAKILVVPEPSCLVLLAAGMIWCRHWSRRG